jgi:hypothetical protein
MLLYKDLGLFEYRKGTNGNKQTEILKTKILASVFNYDKVLMEISKLKY